MSIWFETKKEDWWIENGELNIRAWNDENGNIYAIIKIEDILKEYNKQSN